MPHLEKYEGITVDFQTTSLESLSILVLFGSILKTKVTEQRKKYSLNFDKILPNSVIQNFARFCVLKCIGTVPCGIKFFSYYDPFEFFAIFCKNSSFKSQSKGSFFQCVICINVLRIKINKPI